ncbi:MAG TPA: hypothetical protein VFX97_11315 [Pyrinomonadaceae bacterium]|nr:hypothetical protein [Pyrinomonadaceae bacterium]
MPKSLSPVDIEIFISNHPDADLTKVWQALGIKDNDAPRAVAECSSCKAETFFYDLDNEPRNEALLRVVEGEAVRFVVFKAIERPDKWKVLGHADVWGKYIEPYHMILLSGGKPWLVIRGQGASGSGVALYIDYIFQISGGRLRQVAGYSAAGIQSGAPDGATREFAARPVSLEVSHGRAIVELDLSVSYSMPAYDTSPVTELFSKRQRATLIKKLSSGSPVLDASRSDLSQHEFDSVYNIDSLYGEDFVKYNFAELSQIATGNRRGQREWLLAYLKECESTPEVRKLRRMLTQ